MQEAGRLPSWAAPYLLLQSIGVLGWWVLLLAVPQTRLIFFVGQDWLQWILPDMLILVLGGGICAFAIYKSNRWSEPLLCTLAGGALYAFTLDLCYCAATRVGWLGPILMLPTIIVPGYLCWRSAR